MTAAELITLLGKHPEAPIVFVQGASDALWPLPLEARHVALNSNANAWVVDLGATGSSGATCKVCGRSTSALRKEAETPPEELEVILFTDGTSAHAWCLYRTDAGARERLEEMRERKEKE